MRTVKIKDAQVFHMWMEQARMCTRRLIFSLFARSCDVDPHGRLAKLEPKCGHDITRCLVPEMVKEIAANWKNEWVKESFSSFSSPLGRKGTARPAWGQNEKLGNKVYFRGRKASPDARDWNITNAVSEELTYGIDPVTLKSEKSKIVYRMPRLVFLRTGVKIF